MKTRTEGAGSRPKSKTDTEIVVIHGGRAERRTDQLATEEPVEIRLLAGEARRTVAVTMRTPGKDFELAAGFLFGEGIVPSPEVIQTISYCVDPELDADQQYNVVNVRLRGEHLPDLRTLERHFYTTSACGVCGKANLDALRMLGCPTIPPGPRVPLPLLTSLPEKLRGAQDLFQVTGGLHAAALFDIDGNLLALREDVGRHNALDKLVGWALLERRLPLDHHIVMVSGRASFELLQKSLMAQLPIFCAVSAPSSLAVQVAREFGITLVGFLRGESFNIYTGAERIHVDATDS